MADFKKAVREVLRAHAREQLALDEAEQKDVRVTWLAQALFRTDEQVVAFVASVADAEVKGAVTELDETRLAKAMERAWERDENGWATRARNRAARVLRLYLQAVDVVAPGGMRAQLHRVPEHVPRLEPSISDLVKQLVPAAMQPKPTTCRRTAERASLHGRTVVSRCLLPLGHAGACGFERCGAKLDEAGVLYTCTRRRGTCDAARGGEVVHKDEARGVMFVASRPNYGLRCGARHPTERARCTLPPGHEGEHMAHTKDDVQRWEREQWQARLVAGDARSPAVPVVEGVATFPGYLHLVAAHRVTFVELERADQHCVYIWSLREAPPWVMQADGKDIVVDMTEAIVHDGAAVAPHDWKQLDALTGAKPGLCDCPRCEERRRTFGRPLPAY